MSLRIRLNLLITLLFISLFICSSFYIVANARTTVHHETEATANLALKLIRAALSSISLGKNANEQLYFLQELLDLKETRHLSIDIKDPFDTSFDDNNFDILDNTDAPGWFVKLVKPPQVELKHWLYEPDIHSFGIMVYTNPSDEINENWQEVRNVLILLFIFIILANILVYFSIGYYLAPLDTILSGLSGIEKGDYQLKLPHFRLPELERISQRFNHMAKVLLKSKAENQLLTQHSLTIQENERRHLAQELHDELGQTIAAIKAVATAIMRDRKPNFKQINSSVKTIVQYSDHIYKVAKNMMYRLRPSVLDEFGLIKALQNMIDHWNSHQDNVFFHFSFSDIPNNLSETLTISLFRIIQESLTNILKHAFATKAFISIKMVEKDNLKQIHLSIKDDGVGMNLAKTDLGLGILGMGERVKMLGGKIDISSENNGLMIAIFIPLENGNLNSE